MPYRLANAQYYLKIPVAIPPEQPILPPDYKRKERYENIIAILNRSAFIILNTHYKRPHPGRLMLVFHTQVRTVNYFLSKSLRTASLGELNGFLGRMISFLCGVTPTNLYPHIGRKFPTSFERRSDI